MGIGSWPRARVTLTRRELLRDAALACGGCAFASPTSAFERMRPRSQLLIIRLRGGADGLSIVPPWGDRAYARARPTSAVPPPGRPGGAIDLDGYFGLHPSLLRLIRDHAVDVLPACGFAESTRSHLLENDALDRVLVSLGARPVAALDDEVPGYPSSAFGRAVARAAREVRSSRAPRVLVVERGGWDHHARQASGTLASSLSELALGITAFTRDVGPAWSDTTVVTVSEFGRAVRENRHGGTEHGHATAMLVIRRGTPRGRLMGGWPGLANAEVVGPTILVQDVLGSL